MPPVNLTVAILLGAILALPAIGLPADPTPAPPKNQPPVGTSATPPGGRDIVYTPPKRGMPGGRVGGGSRSAENQRPVILVLAPDHVALTMQEQPSLFWYVSQATSGPVLFTLIDSRAVTPIVETGLTSPSQGGVQRIRLADYGIRLTTGVSYRWFVTLVLDPDKRSKDVVGGGMIERVPLIEALSVNLASTGNEDTARRYAEAGLWYDAIAVLSDQIDAAPQDSVYRKDRASLLEQVGLPEIAAYDRNGQTHK